VFADNELTPAIRLPQEAISNSVRLRCCGRMRCSWIALATAATAKPSKARSIRVHPGGIVLDTVYRAATTHHVKAAADEMSASVWAGGKAVGTPGDLAFGLDVHAGAAEPVDVWNLSDD